MSFEHPMVRLGDYVDACLGKMLDAQKNRGVLQPYLGNSNVRWGAFDLQDLAVMRFEEHEEVRYSIQDGDLIVCEGGEPGRCAIWRSDVTGMKIQKALHRVRVKEGLDNYFLYYWFLQAGKTGELEPFFTGTTIKHLTGKALAELQIPLPPIGAQHGLAKVLKSLDDKIDLNRRINQTLEAIAQAIFKSWFVDFEPVKAKIAAKQTLTLALSQGEREQIVLRAAMSAISGKSDAELDQLKNLPSPSGRGAGGEGSLYDQLAAIAALFPDEMEESEMGEIPRGWQIQPLSQMVELIGGGTPKRSEAAYWNGDIPWFTVKDAPNDGDVFVVKTEEHITEDGLKKSSTRLLPEGVTIISARGTVGKLALVGKPMAMNQSCYGVRGVNGIERYFNYFNLQNAVETLKRNTHGAVFDTITLSTFETVWCVKPDNSIADDFERVVCPLLSRIKSNLVEVNALATLRDTLLPKLLSGELSVAAPMAEAKE